MNINNAQYWAEYGWICPKCGRVMSPKESECIYCNSANSTSTTLPYTDRPISKETGNE